MANLIQITSVPAEIVPDGMMQIVARWKETKDKPISKENRARAILLPANIWSGQIKLETPALAETGNSETVKQLRLHLLDSLEDLAKSYLSAICEESMQRTQVPLEHFQLSNLLQWNADRAALSGRLNGEEIKNWLSQSVTIRTVTEKHGEKIGGALGEQFVKLASPNHGLTPEKASKILESIWNPDDCESTTGLRVQMRLTAISKKNENSENLLDSIL